jgi:N-acetylglutamate synthase-like GNAT family acetyltransferase
MEQIKDLVESVGGDLDRLHPEQFVVTRDAEQRIIGCVRLKPYPGFYELASLAVSDNWRASGVGREMVNALLNSHQGPVFLICEDQVIEFFRRFGFSLIPGSEMPPGLEQKITRYTAESGHINVMRRDWSPSMTGPGS